MTALPEDLRSSAIKTPNVPAAVVCPDQDSILLAVKAAQEMSIIEPTLVGNKDLIHQTAKKINIDIKNLKIINNDGTNVYDLIKYKNVIMTSSSVKNIQNRILNEKN